MLKRLSPSKEFRTAFPFLLPTILVLLFVAFYPLLFAFALSLRDWKFHRIHRPFIGLENYARVLTDPSFFNSLRVTIIFAVGTTSLSIIVGLILAKMLSGEMKGKEIIRALFLIPFVTTPVVAGLSWRGFFWDGEFGLINFFLGLLRLPTHNWLIRSPSALIAVIITDSWIYIPLATLLLDAALSNLPKAPFEAAQIDGASRWQSFIHLTLPMLREPLIFIILLRFTMAYRSFDIIYVMTGGGPAQATRVLSMHIYSLAMSTFQMGYANATSYMGLVVVAAVSILLVRFSIERTGRQRIWQK